MVGMAIVYGLMLFRMGADLVWAMLALSLVFLLLRAVYEEWRREWLGTSPRVLQFRVPRPIPRMGRPVGRRMRRIDK